MGERPRDTSIERRQVQDNLARLQEAIGREVGWAPTARRWILPIVAFAVGTAVALGRRRRARALGTPAGKLGPRRVPKTSARG